MNADCCSITERLEASPAFGERQGTKVLTIPMQKIEGIDDLFGLWLLGFGFAELPISGI
jgi:hypothetical protein